MATGHSEHHPSAEHDARYRALLALTALGVVYGDIGTSPLYAMRECFAGPHGLPLTEANVLGVLSLITWSLILVISIKYLVFILRADNDGEGGILALAALVLPQRGRMGWRGTSVMLLGLFGAALLYGDGMITPAISVLSAVEGLEVALPVLSPYVLPLTIAILLALFLVQRRGTAGVGRVFGPITLVWFLTLVLLGLPHLLSHPGILTALSPLHALEFFLRNGPAGFLALGAVFLVVTGGEALYADMGHFGPAPIRFNWFVLVLPALLVNYYGQGALLLADPDTLVNPFYRMAPDWARLPLVGMATLATVIASQAVISGAFSLTMQAVRMGFSPRLAIRHTSVTERGQIYIPAINWILMIACIALVIGFRSSTGLAAAYGIAVSTTMVITTLLFYVVAVRRWSWPRPLALALCLAFLIFDLAFFGANLAKFLQGGWVPLGVAALVLMLMTTWKRGREILADRLRERTPPLSGFLDQIDAHPPARVPGTAVFLFSNPKGVPPALRRNMDFNHVLHNCNIILTIRTTESPRVPDRERLTVEHLRGGFWRVIARYGFMEDPQVPNIIERLTELEHGPTIEPDRTDFFLGRETLLATDRPGMALWREELFAFLARNARDAGQYFGLPPERVIEMGAQIEL